MKTFSSFAGSIATPVSLDYVVRPYATQMELLHDSNNPNSEIYLAGSLLLNITGVAESETGSVILVRGDQGNEVVSCNVPILNAEKIPTAPFSEILLTYKKANGRLYITCEN